MLEGFVALPDSEGIRTVEAFLPFAAPTVVRHSSGRPWLIGHWPQDEFTEVVAGEVRVALIGWCPVTTVRLTEMASRIRTLGDVDALARALPGNFHLIASVDGAVRVQGSITGLRRVFHASVDGMAVAADRADVLASAGGAEIDEDLLAVQLIATMLPPPLAERSMWRGVHPVPADCYLTLRPAQPPQVTTWWRAPEPELSLAEGAPAVREALETATRLPGRLSADLSGGLDSTSLCFLAARTSPDLVTARQFNGDPGNDDPVWAGLAAAALPQAEHLVIPQDDLPAMFAGLGEIRDREQPVALLRTTPREIRYATMLAERGARWHLAGHGGDELFTPSLTYLHTLARRAPGTAVRHVRGHRALNRWPLCALAAGLASNRGIAEAWTRRAASLDAPPATRRTLDFDWLPHLRVPVWASADMVATARRVFRETAETIEPLAHDRGQHGTLAYLRGDAPAYRMLARHFRQAGLSLRMPYFDDRVVEAGLAVRVHERTAPWQYKPLLVAAMRGVVPDAILARRTKGEFSVNVYDGFRRHLPEVLELFTDSMLAGRGLIDADALRARILAPHRDNRALVALDASLAAELWLRAVSGNVSLPPTSKVA